MAIAISIDLESFLSVNNTFVCVWLFALWVFLWVDEMMNWWWGLFQFFYWFMIYYGLCFVVC